MAAIVVSRPKTPVSVITGFLGSGKTTLINSLLKNPRMAETAVLVNEFGQIGIDHLLVETLDDDVLLMDAGCLCCTIRDDLSSTLRSLFARRDAGEIPDFRRVVIETTGLADPAPILHTLLTDMAALEHGVVDGIVTTVDAVNGGNQLATHTESVKQAAVADRLLITKADIAEPEALAEVRERLASINPGATILEASHGDIGPDALFDAGPFDAAARHPDVSRWLGEERAASRHPAHGHDVNRHDDRIRALSLTADVAIEIYPFVLWIEQLLEAHGDRILRLKGVLNVLGDDRPVVVHGVQHVFHPLTRLSSWPDSDRRSRLVLIVMDLDTVGIEADFHKLVTSGARQPSAFGAMPSSESGRS